MSRHEFVVRLDAYDKGRNRPGAALPIRAAWQAINVIIMNSWLVPFSSWKVGLLRLFGARVGVGAVIKPCVSIKYPWKLTLGDHVWLGERVWIDNVETVKLGSHVCVSQGACFITGNHDYRDPSFGLITSGIVAEDGVWVGARSTVCPGVSLKRNSVLTVGSILTRNTEENGIYAGNPAEFIRWRFPRVDAQ